MFSISNIRIGWYLAWRQLRRASLWTTGLIVFVMFLTFLNLVIVTGVLVGIVEGINSIYQSKQFGDVSISAGENKNYIEKSAELISIIQSSQDVASYTARYVSSGNLEANYKSRTDLNKKANMVGAQVIGIDPTLEDKFSRLSEQVIEGDYLEPDDFDKVLVGWYLLTKYQEKSPTGEDNLKDVVIGSRLRLSINGVRREVIVKGIIKSKIEMGMSVFMTDNQLRALVNRDDQNVSQIAIKLKQGVSPENFRDNLKYYATTDTKVQTFAEGIPSNVKDISTTFALLGNGLSSIGLVVAAITIFIVVFINAITRRKFIGILRGIGISGSAIEISYMFQSLFYAISGSGIGLLLIYGFLVPHFIKNPIDFPFGDGILAAPVAGTAIRVLLLIITTILAGYFPSRMIVKKNILDSILGRN